jgi:cysteine desulfurase
VSSPIYLDHNATTPLLDEVVEAMMPFLTTHFGNPSSDHVYGRPARDAVELARSRVAALLGASAREIVFTSGGTEANNLAIFGVMQQEAPPRRLLTSVIEHPATSAPCARLEAQGFGVDRIPVDEDGRIDLKSALERLAPSTALVSVMHSNNETGVIQPIAELARAARDAGARVHTDAAQSAGKLPLSVDELGVDLLSIAGHKLYAPKGVGALYVRSGTRIEPLVRGAGHEHGLRPGTENVASIVGLGAACAIAERTLASEAERVRALRDRLWQLLRAEIADLALNGGAVERLPNTLSVRFAGVRGSELLARAPQIAASTGSACHEAHERASDVITAMGIDPVAALGTVRLTLGRHTRERDIERATQALIAAWRELSDGAGR